MWCVFSPVHLHVDRRAQALAERTEEVRHEFGRQAADGLARRTCPRTPHRPGRTGRWPPGRAASSIGSRNPKRAMPRLSPSASRSACPSASAQSSTVWCSSICRSPLQASCKRESAVPGHLLEHVVEKADTGRDCDGRTAIEVHVDRDVRLLGDARDGRRRVEPAQLRRDRGPGLRVAAVESHPQSLDAEIAPRAPCRCRDRRSRRCAAGPGCGRRGTRSAGRCGACGNRSRPAAGADRRIPRRTSMPCEANSSRRKSCGSRKSGSGKVSVPRPSWLLTSTSR